MPRRRYEKIWKVLKDMDGTMQLCESLSFALPFRTTCFCWTFSFKRLMGNLSDFPFAFSKTTFSPRTRWIHEIEVEFWMPPRFVRFPSFGVIFHLLEVLMGERVTFTSGLSCSIPADAVGCQFCKIQSPRCRKMRGTKIQASEKQDTIMRGDFFRSMY